MNRQNRHVLHLHDLQRCHPMEPAALPWHDGAHLPLLVDLRRRYTVRLHAMCGLLGVWSRLASTAQHPQSRAWTSRLLLIARGDEQTWRLQPCGLELSVVCTPFA